MSTTLILKDEISSRMTGSHLAPIFAEERPDLRARHREETSPRKMVRVIVNSPVEPARSTWQAMMVCLSRWHTGFVPKTELGKALYALRQKAVASGMRLLSEDEILEEVKRRRGELQQNETDLC